MNKKKLAYFTARPNQVHLDEDRKPVIFTKRPLDTYRAARRHAAKLLRKSLKKSINVQPKPR